MSPTNKPNRKTTETSPMSEKGRHRAPFDESIKPNVNIPTTGIPSDQ